MLSLSRSDDGVGVRRTIACFSVCGGETDQIHMGTLVSITAVAENDQAANRAIDAGFKEVKRLEQLLSTWIPESEMSRVNAAAGVMPIPVSPDTLAVVQRALQVAEMTGGGFNIAIGPAVEAWNVIEGQRIPTESELEALRPLLDLKAVHVDMRERRSFLKR